MRAVNLIPEDERRGAGGAAGRTGGAAYVLTGGLVLAVAMSSAYALTSKSVSDKKSELARIEVQATSAEAQAQSLAKYQTYAATKAARLQTVTSIANSRFDWAHVMHELGRVIPTNITVQSIKGTVAPAVTVDGGPSVPLRSSLPVPALEVAGCAPSQAAIPGMLTSLRSMDGAQRVTLQQSVYQGGAANQASGTSDSNGVPKAPGAKPTTKIPNCKRQFTTVVFFDAKPTPSAPVAAAAPAPTTAPVSTGGAK